MDGERRLRAVVAVDLARPRLAQDLNTAAVLADRRGWDAW